MNLNELFVTEFSEHIGYPVAEDIYEDDESDIYFTFSYEDETPTQFGDDRPLFDTAYIQLRMHTPKEFNYHELKRRTGEYFESRGFQITSKFSFLETTYESVTQSATSNKRSRCTVFKMNYTDKH
ncbi:MAG: hypothetical protein E7290_02030 [Lachnospiraceae bacterium]|nr:hypothetical protein [Lachnospiraceae bacterium]